MIELIFIILALLLCLALCFLFSGTETAIISINRYRLRTLHEQGDASAGRLLDLLSNTQRMLIMVLVGTSVAGVLLTLFFDYLIQTQWPELANQPVYGYIKRSHLISMAVLSPIVILFAEIVPKTLFRAKADSLMLPLRPVFLVSLFIMKPLIVILERFARLVLSPLSEQRTRVMRQVTRQDVIDLIAPEDDDEEEEAPGYGNQQTDEESPAVAVSQNPLQEELPTEETDERGMIQNIMRLQETQVREIMTPLVELTAFRLDLLDIESIKKLARASGYSRYPVFKDRVFNIIGFIDIYRVLREWTPERRMEDFIERPHYVPETKRLDDLLQDILRLRVKNAVVVNEFGGCSGWISREDIFEEIVGELQDELDEPPQGVMQEDENVYLIEGRMEIDAVNEALGTEFSDDDWETLAGMILAEMGRIPREGDQISLDGWRAAIVGMEGHRIARIRLTKDR